jgi:Predicted transcriptional regulators
MRLEDTQLLKGILEGCVLAIIRRGETYGYEILSSLEKQGFDNLIEGTLYPVLTRMEKKGFILCRIGKSPLGPKRKYYSITAEGEQWLKDFTMQYQTVTRKADNILLGEIKYENE